MMFPLSFTQLNGYLALLVLSELNITLTLLQSMTMHEVDDIQVHIFLNCN